MTTNFEQSLIPEDLLFTLTEFIAGANWRQAKMAAPHSYVRDFEYPDFVRLVEYCIARFGYYEKFRGIPYKYINIGDYRYWVIRPILNRALHVDAPGE